MKKYLSFTAVLFLVAYACYGQQKREGYLLSWPDQEHWKVGSSHDNDQMFMVELTRDSESLTNWTEMGSMISYKGVTGKNVEEMRDSFFTTTKKSCPNAKLTTLSKDLSAKYPSIIFSIECSGYADGSGPESQVWQVVQGQYGLYVNQRDLKVSIIPEKVKMKFVEFFRTGKV